MSRTKIDIVKEILLRKGDSNQAENESIDDSARIQSKYIRRLQTDIHLVSSFINQANTSIEKLISKNSNTSQEDIGSLKKDIIALSDTYERLPYLSDKGDVIGIATASTIIDNLIQQQNEASIHLNEKNVKAFNERISMDALVEDYSRFLQLIDQRIITDQSKLNEIHQKTISMDEEPVTRSVQINALDTKLNEAYDLEDLLSSYLNRIVIKYLAVGDWEIQKVVTEEKFQENVNLCMQLMDNLVASSMNSMRKGTRGDWVQVHPNFVESKLINHLLMNDLVVSREDSTIEKSILMLRDFGLEF